MNINWAGKDFNAETQRRGDTQKTDNLTTDDADFNSQKPTKMMEEFQNLKTSVSSVIEMVADKNLPSRHLPGSSVFQY
ncbi:MAG: hypothetical protein WBS33_10105 [Verrucomicrobiia bacterium]